MTELDAESNALTELDAEGNALRYRVEPGIYSEAALAAADPEICALLRLWQHAASVGWTVTMQPDREGWMISNADGSAGASFRPAGSLGASVTSMHNAEYTMTLTGATLGGAVERVRLFHGWDPLVAQATAGGATGGGAP